MPPTVILPTTMPGGEASLTHAILAGLVSNVIILVLVTNHFGDEAGQGFMHGFAGIVLFAVALTLTYGLDRLLAARFDDEGGTRGKR